MTILAEPTVIIPAAAYAAEPTTPAASHPRQRSTTVHTVASPRRGQPVDVSATTEELLRQRDQLPADHPDRAKLRARAIEKNLPLANHLARRYAGRGELVDDLAQVAAVALIKAVDRYDPSRQTAFASYAVPSVLGALKRHFRDTAWGMRVPRSTQELVREVATAAGELSQQRGRSPTAVELADHLQVDVDDLLAAIGASQAYHLVSLNAPHAGTDSADLVDLIEVIGGTDPRYAGVDNHLLLRPLLAALPLRERRILTMRFYGQMSQTRIASEIGLSQMHVSRLLRRSLSQLRAAMVG
jgi:RNA polymerase sigma-B factor